MVKPPPHGSITKSPGSLKNWTSDSISPSKSPPFDDPVKTGFGVAELDDPFLSQRDIFWHVGWLRWPPSGHELDWYRFFRPNRIGGNDPLNFRGMD